MSGKEDKLYFESEEFINQSSHFDINKFEMPYSADQEISIYGTKVLVKDFNTVPMTEKESGFITEKENEKFKEDLEEKREELYDLSKSCSNIYIAEKYFELPESYVKRKFYDFSPLITITITLLIFVFVVLSQDIPGIDWSFGNFKNWLYNFELFWNVSVEKKYWVILVIGLIASFFTKTFLKGVMGKDKCIEKYEEMADEEIQNIKINRESERIDEITSEVRLKRGIF